MSARERPKGRLRVICWRCLVLVIGRVLLGTLGVSDSTLRYAERCGCWGHA